MDDGTGQEGQEADPDRGRDGAGDAFHVVSEDAEEKQERTERGGRRGRSRLSAAAGITVAVLALLVALLWQRCGLRGCPDVADLRGYMPDEASVLLDRNGEELGKLFVTQRFVVPYDSIPKNVQDAFVAMEDQRFWEHDGVDWKRVAGALWQNVKSLGIEEGSSTITMQLARNAFPDRLPARERTVWRKLGEARVALDIEEVYDKTEILALYLNQIYFGNGAYGIEAAAQEYFGKSASQLDLAEAAMLAALPRAPSRLNPRSNPAGALEGRREVLERMVAQGMITREQAGTAASEKLELQKGESEGNRAPYFVEAVRRQLEDALGDAIYTGGYRIHTTLDLDAQAAVETALESQLEAIEEGRYGRFRHPTLAGVHADTVVHEGTSYLQAAAIVMDAHTGDVLALVGGRDFDDSQFNRATQARRQPGSAFKPFVYTTALAAGYPPTEPIEDSPIRLALGHGRYWEPENYGGHYSGVATLREGLVHSKNVVTVRVANQVGIDAVLRTAERMGLGPDLPSNPSVVLGTAEVTPLQLTAAYAGFATLGERPEPRFVTSVEDRQGRNIWSDPPETVRVLDPAVAFLTTTILQDVVNYGTGTAVRAVGFRGAVAGKTGTTQDAADLWFIGYTPRYVGTVWIGFDKRMTVLRGAEGGELAAPVWGRFMKKIANEDRAPWSPPPGVVRQDVDDMGEIIADGCPWYGHVHSVYFLTGTVPFRYCPSERPDTMLWDTLFPGMASWDTFARDTASWETLPHDSMRWDTLARDTTSRDSMRDTTALETPRWDRLRRDTLRRDTLRLDTLRLDTLRRDTPRRDTLRRDILRRDILRRDTLRRDTLRRDTLRRDTPRRDTLSGEAPRLRVP